jgi:hypothetical protein
MSGQLQGLDTFTRLSSSVFGWSNFWYFYEEDAVFYYESMGVTRQIQMDIGDKVKMQVRVIVGTDSLTAEDACRFLIRKA